jgi:hypothetical protein
MFGQHDNDFFPHHTSLLLSAYDPVQVFTTAHLGIIDIMDLIKDDEFNISDQISSFVKHTSQNLGRHLPISYFPIVKSV